LKIIILGKGLVGTALINRLSLESNYQVFGINSRDCDLRERKAVENLFSRENPDLVIFAAGVVGGIEKNLNNSLDLILQNSRIIVNVIEAASVYVPRFINLVPACVYPADIDRRMRPEDLFTGKMEKSSLGYSTAKLSGVVMSNTVREQLGLNWISVIATNLYGDEIFKDSHNAHVIPALIKKFQDARKNQVSAIELLGNGTPIREFLHVDDFANAIALIVKQERIKENVINVPGIEAISIKDLAELIKVTTGYEGSYTFSQDGKNGASMKLLDGSKIMELGWNQEISLSSGLRRILG
jgi:GDP-L-fucose synthase